MNQLFTKLNSVIIGYNQAAKFNYMKYQVVESLT
jgi:hypothetical protein